MVEGAGRPHVARLIEQMSHDDRVDLLRRLPPRWRRACCGWWTRPTGGTSPLCPVRGEHGRRPDDDRLRLAAAGRSPRPRRSTSSASRRPNRETIYYIYVLDEPDAASCSASSCRSAT